MVEPIIRKIARDDNEAVARIIRTVMPEFGAGGAGFAIHDAEVDDMYGAYTHSKAAYFVCQADGELLGGGGVGPLPAAGSEYCELKKMYFLPAGRGRGLGQKLLTTCLEEARVIGYRCCYIETFNTMTQAMKVYERNGFQKITGPLGNTGHFACDVFYLLDL